MLINPFPSCLTENDLLSEGTIALLASKWQELGRKVVPAGTAYAIGYGNERGMDNAVGRVYMKIYDDTVTPVAEPGMVRLELRDPQDRPIETLAEWRTEQLETSATDRQQMIPLPEHVAAFGEDWSLVLMFRPDAADTVVKGNCKILLDVTIYTVR